MNIRALKVPDAWSAPRGLFVVIVALVGLGLVVLASASTDRAQTLHGDSFFLLKRQMAWMGLGAVAMLVCARIDYRRWRALAWPLAIGTAGLLVLVLVIGPEIGGSRRWLRLPFGIMNFQPSELAKMSMVVLLAHWLGRRPWRMAAFRHGVLGPGSIIGAACLLILAEPDFGSTLLLAMVGGCLLFVGGTLKRWLVAAAGLGGGLLGLFLRFDERRWERILAWIWPDRYLAKSYQLREAIKAFVLGGLGVNLGGGMAKHGYLPEVHTDFIFAIAGEELGLWGSLGIVALFAALIVYGCWISLRAPDLFGRYLALGITLTIGLQAILNMAVVTGCLPTKGITLPFFSYGGSSLFFTLAQCGILLNIGWAGDNRSREAWSGGGHGGGERYG